MYKLLQKATDLFEDNLGAILFGIIVCSIMQFLISTGI